MLLTPSQLHDLLLVDYMSGRLWWKNSTGKKPEALTSLVGSEKYLGGKILGKQYRAHRVIWAMANMRWPDEVDHKDHIVTHNWLSNLVEATRLQNARNRAPNRNNTSGEQCIQVVEINTR